MVTLIFGYANFMKTRWITPLFSGLTLIVNPLTIHACSVCITGANDSTADAFNWSVLFLMATPYLVVGSIAGGLFFAYRRAVTKREQAETPEPLVQLAWNDKESR
jgi:chromate transport protein ChrA